MQYNADFTPRYATAPLFPPGGYGDGKRWELAPTGRHWSDIATRRTTTAPSSNPPASPLRLELYRPNGDYVALQRLQLGAYKRDNPSPFTRFHEPRPRPPKVRVKRMKSDRTVLCYIGTGILCLITGLALFYMSARFSAHHERAKIENKQSCELYEAQRTIVARSAPSHEGYIKAQEAAELYGLQCNVTTYATALRTMFGSELLSFKEGTFWVAIVSFLWSDNLRSITSVVSTLSALFGFFQFTRKGIRRQRNKEMRQHVDIDDDGQGAQRA